MKKALIFLILGVSTVALLTGCKPKGDPAVPMTAYYQDIKDGNLEGAYAQLADATTKTLPKEDFLKWQNSMTPIQTLKSFTITKSTEYKNKAIDGTTFKNVVEFNVTEKAQDLYENKEVSINYTRDVVNENGVWKVYKEKINIKDTVAKNIVSLAYMYIDGKGQTRDLNQALTVLNDGIMRWSSEIVTLV